MLYFNTIIELYKRGVEYYIFNSLLKNYPVCNLGDIGSFKSGYGFKNSYQGYLSLPIPFFKVSDMNNIENNIIMRKANNYVSESMALELKINPFQEKSIVFAKVGAALFKERKRIVDAPFIIDNNMMAFSLASNIVFDYVFSFFNAIKLSTYAQTGALPSLNSSDLVKIKIPIPSNQFQNKIARIMCNLDKKINYEIETMKLINSYKFALLQQMFI